MRNPAVVLDYPGRVAEAEDMTTTADTDIRIAAWTFGRKSTTMGMAYRQLEAGNPLAVRVFAALAANEWGVKAAFEDGIMGVDIVATQGATTYAWTGGEPYGEPHVSRTIVAANGGTVWAS